jgi:hypothetical protein
MYMSTSTKGFFCLIIVFYLASYNKIWAQNTKNTSDSTKVKENAAVITTQTSTNTSPINNPNIIITVDNSPKTASPQEKNTGFIEVQGRNISYYNLRQKDELVALFTPYGLKEGANGHFYISRFNEVTKGWNGTKLFDSTYKVIIDLETFYSSD